VVDNSQPGTGTTTYSYDAASNVASATYPNSIQSILTYDQLNRISGLATQVSGYLYQRYAVGKRTSATDLNSRTTTWNYDGIYRLTGETVAADPASNNGSASYGLDPVGNRQSEISTMPGAHSGSFNYDIDDRIASELYDPNGNTISTGGRSYIYDSENHLISANGGAVTYIYDGDGNRVAKSVNGVVTRYLIDDLNQTGFPQVVEELSGSGAVQREYTYGMTRISESQPINNVWTTSYYGYDGMGSVRQLTSSNGAVTDTYDYDAFGNKIASTGSTPNNYLYRGEQFDTDAGMYYLRARYYNPQTGRFVSHDPWPGQTSDPQSMHKYVYTRGNPTNRIDPFGMADLVEEDLEDSEGESAEEGERAVAREVNCILETGAAALDVLSQSLSLEGVLQLVQLGVNFSQCSASGKYEENPGTCSLCFAAGTPIHTNHGNVPVEQIEIGDEVEARDGRTGKIENRKVTALTKPHHDMLLQIRVEGEHSPLRPSTHHPFWARHGDDPSGRWIVSGQLQVGDLLQTASGQWHRITAISALHDETTVYNFTVDQDHDYFVGETGFLAHNKNCGCKYRDTFFDNYPELEDDVVVHHAIEQQVLNNFPGLFSPEEIHSLSNLRGIPNEYNDSLHLSLIRKEWDQFYRDNPTATRRQFFSKRTAIDKKFGCYFNPRL
jgi:RHS repeat-associated protein